MSGSSILASPPPDSPRSLFNVSATIDKLTGVLSNYSRSASPEPPHVSTCCCGRESCESTKAWSAYKAKLESRLVLSAEIGQALLQKHEAYVRQHEPSNLPNDSPLLTLDSPDLKRTEEQVDVRVAELLRENAVLEKRLSQALLNSEIADVAQQNTLEELKQAEERARLLTAQNARLVGIQQRLDKTLQEKDDIQQERDSAVQRARVAEMRSGSLKEKYSNLQAQVSRMRQDVETRQSHRRELSEEIIADARNHLQQLVRAGRPVASGDGEVTRILESLVSDNELLKENNSELQTLLSATREELRTIQDELNERRANITEYPGLYDDEVIIPESNRSFHTPTSSTFNFGTAPAHSVLHSVYTRPEAGPSQRRSHSVERGFRRGAEPLTPETNRRPLSPPAAISPNPKRGSTRYPSSHLSLEMESHLHNSITLPGRTLAQSSLLALTRSRAVQTDSAGLANLSPSPFPRTYGDPSQDGHSETSSYDSSSSVVGVIVERTAQLVNRLVQADALTLTNRLKRQRLLGADVSHLSRTTVSAILNEANALRAQFRAFLEDEKVITTCTRKDLRALFKLFKDMFAEIGQLRVTMNDVILDPAVAVKVSEMALHRSKAGASGVDGPSGAPSTTPAWIAPLSKLLGLDNSQNTQDEAASKALSPPRPISRSGRPPPRVAPKREAALSASAMTVNVEFSGSGVGRAIASTIPEAVAPVPPTSSSNQLSAISSESSRSVMDIFAGAPRPAPTADPWVVVPKPRTGATGARRYDIAGGGTIGRSTLRRATDMPVSGSESDGRLSRIVDAMLDSQTSPTLPGDDESRDVVPSTLLERTLRRRGLSDTSIHTTYMEHATEEPQGQSLTRLSQEDKPSVFRTLSRRMQSFRFSSATFAPAAPPIGTTTTATAAESVEAGSSTSRPQTPANGLTSASKDVEAHRNPNKGTDQASVNVLSRFPNLSMSWAASALPPEMTQPDLEEIHHPAPASFYVGRPRDEAALNRAWTRGREV